MGGTCENCKACRFDYSSNAWKGKCAQMPANIDFGWSAGDIPYGRFISEINHLEDCHLWQEGAAKEEMAKRAREIDLYIEKQREAGNEYASKFINRIANMLAKETQ